DDEVGVLLGDMRGALAGALQVGGLHQPPGGVSGRVLEDTSAVLGPDGLRAVPFRGQPGHLELRGAAVSAAQPDDRLCDDRPREVPVPQSRGAVAEAEAVRAPDLTAATGLDALGLHKHLGQIDSYA